MGTQVTMRNAAGVSSSLAAAKPSLPACATSRLASLSGKMNAPTLPKDLMLTGRDQVAVRQAISNYRSALSQAVPANSDAAAERMGAVLGGMFMQWPMFGASREQISALTVRYLGAVADLPPWAVQEAVHRWRDGKWELEFGESFEKIPSSATLKRIAEYVKVTAENELACLERIDAAVAEIPVILPSPEERERIGERFRALSRELGEKVSMRNSRGRGAYVGQTDD
jgi:hypothetical protein